jgi:carboxylesterase
MKKREIIPNAEPFYFPGNKIGCLLTHGFTGAPTEMRPLGEYLNNLGYTVLGVRLSGHGTNLDAMIRSRWQDWSASVEDGWHLLESHTEQIFMIGLSMGGALTLQNAPKLSPRGIVTMSTPIYFPNKFVDNYPWLVKLLSIFRPNMEKGEGGWVNREAALGHISYSSNPLRSALELKTLITEMKLSLPEINVPTLMMHSKDDNYVTADHAEKLFKLLEVEDKELFWVKDSDHVITRDGNPQIVFEKVAEFIKAKQR